MSADPTEEFDSETADPEYAELFDTGKLVTGRGGRAGYESAFDSYRGHTAVKTPQRRLRLEFPDGERTELSDIDMDFRVTFPAGSPATFDVSLWNLQRETWRKISRGARIDLEAGWRDGPLERFIRGEIRTTHTHTRRGDNRFRLRGVDVTATQTDRRFSKTWRGASPTEIVRQIAAELGLQPGLLDTTPPINRAWAITADRPIAHWLDELRKEAEAQTGEPWIWSSERGELSFHRQRVRQEPIAELSQLDSMLEYQPSSHPQTGPYARTVGQSATDTIALSDSVHSAQEFVAYIEPALRRGRRIRVHELPPEDERRGQSRKALRNETTATDYALAEFEIATGSTGFRHHARGTLVPLLQERGDR